MRSSMLRKGIVGLMLIIAFVYLHRADLSRPIRNQAEASQRNPGNQLLQKKQMTVEEFAKPRLFEHDPFNAYSRGSLALRKPTSSRAEKRKFFSDVNENEICPIRLVTKRISSEFAVLRRHPYHGSLRPHHGIDCAAPYGSPVSAAEDGRVVFAGRRGEYGNLVILAHDNGWTTWYGHLSRIEPGIRQGAKVIGGRTIGRIGSTGLSTGPHLHFETRMAGRPVNPRRAKLTQAVKVLD